MALLLIALAALPAQHSFDELRARLLENAYAEPPAYGAGVLPELSILGPALGGTLLARLRGTVSDDSDFKDDEPKPIHRAGLCALGRWEATAPTPATGIFAWGARLPAILRFASGTNRAVYSSVLPRNFGIAIKVFPSPSPSARVHTTNLLLFDAAGLAGEVRPGFLVNTPGSAPLRFSNIADESRVANRLAGKVLSKFDDPSAWRRIDQAAAATWDGSQLFAPVAPDEIILAPVPTARPRPRHADYRRELAMYGKGELAFDAWIVMPGTRRPIPVGRFTVDETVMSPFCDGALHFFHAPWQHAP